MPRRTLTLPDYIREAAEELESALYAYLDRGNTEKGLEYSRYTAAQEAMSAAWRRFYEEKEKT